MGGSSKKIKTQKHEDIKRKMFKYKNLTPYRLQINRHRNQHRSTVNIISKNDRIQIEFPEPIFRRYFCPEKRDWDRQNRVNSWYTQYVRVIRHIWIAITRGRPTAEVKPCYFKTSNPPRIRAVNISRSDRSNHETSRRKSRARRLRILLRARHWNSLKQIVGSRTESWNRLERN